MVPGTQAAIHAALHAAGRQAPRGKDGADINVAQTGVKQSIFTKWIKQELDSETACLELPLTILLLLSFACLAMAHLGQTTVMKVEDAITVDITQNANFAVAHNYGHKGIHDVNSYADFWSWTRHGLLPLIANPSPWTYSEELQLAVPYDVGALPSRRNFSGYLKPVPIKNDYLRYNRMIGGFRFRQEVANASEDACFYPGDKEVTRSWIGKPCTGKIDIALPPDYYDAETFRKPERVEWFLTEREDYHTLLQHIVDMEDGCASAEAQNRTCLCIFCASQGQLQPWIDERTQRVEVSFIVYNAQYGIYAMAGVNFWFNRGGHIYKIINVRSAWAGILTRTPEDLAIMLLADIVWLCAVLFVCRTELRELVEMVRSKQKVWYKTLADDYLSFWNFIDWISIFIALLIIVRFFMLNSSTETVNEKLGEMVTRGTPLSKSQHQQEIHEFYAHADAMMIDSKDLREWLVMYPLVLMLRLFKSFAAQPRLAIVTDTFTEAKQDLMHFGIVFLSVWFCFGINAVLFFGQDSVHFADIWRAMNTTFRIMLGDWDWNALTDIGHYKAFFWFAAFQGLMNLLLMNMLMAILMDSYAKVKQGTEGAATLLGQLESVVRRSRQTREGSRVRLNEILSSILEEEKQDRARERAAEAEKVGGNKTVEPYDDEEMMYENDRLIFPEPNAIFLKHEEEALRRGVPSSRPLSLMDIVPLLPKVQAGRTLKSAMTEYKRKNDTPFTSEKLQGLLEEMSERVEASAQCSVWLATKFALYQELEPAPACQRASIQAFADRSSGVTDAFGAEVPVGRAPSTARSARSGVVDGTSSVGSLDVLGFFAQATQTTAEAAMGAAIDRVKDIAEERTRALQDGVASVLAEEMQYLERRQKAQQASMEQMHAVLRGIRQLTYKLRETCGEVAELSRRAGLQVPSPPGLLPKR